VFNTFGFPLLIITGCCDDLDGLIGCQVMTYNPQLVTFILLVTHEISTRYHHGLSLAQWYHNPLVCG